MKLNPEALKAIRQRSGLSKQALADLAGIHASNLTNYESGVRQPSPATVKALADALQVPILAITAPEVAA